MASTQSEFGLIVRTFTKRQVKEISSHYGDSQTSQTLGGGRAAGGATLEAQTQGGSLAPGGLAGEVAGHEPQGGRKAVLVRVKPKLEPLIVKIAIDTAAFLAALA
ncbi:MAG: hypothetical protein ACREFY_21750 [Acetobacteraceae bacterium]